MEACHGVRHHVRDGDYEDRTPEEPKWQEFAKTFREVCVPNTMTRTVYGTR
jgi:hypothetical protein